MTLDRLIEPTAPAAAPDLYADRDAMLLDRAGNLYYSKHVMAITREGLHAKSDIAAELGWRDMEIDRLRALTTEAPAAAPVGIVEIKKPHPSLTTQHWIKHLDLPVGTHKLYLTTEAAPAEPAEAPETLTDEQIEKAARSSGAYSERDRWDNDTGDLIVSIPQLRYFLDEVRALATPPTALQEGAETLTEALSKIASGSFPQAATLALGGQWQKFTEELQSIARRALQEGRAARSPTQEPPKP